MIGKSSSSSSSTSAHGEGSADASGGGTGCSDAASGATPNVDAFFRTKRGLSHNTYRLRACVCVCVRACVYWDMLIVVCVFACIECYYTNPP